MSDWSTVFDSAEVTSRETVIYVGQPEDRSDVLSAFVGADNLLGGDAPIHRRGRFKPNARKQIARSKKARRS